MESGSVGEPESGGTGEFLKAVVASNCRAKRRNPKQSIRDWLQVSSQLTEYRIIYYKESAINIIEINHRVYL